MFLSSSGLNPIWGPASADRRERLPAVAEQTLFPGLVVLLLAIAGACWSGWPRSSRRAPRRGGGLRRSVARLRDVRPRPLPPTGRCTSWCRAGRASASRRAYARSRPSRWPCWPPAARRAMLARLHRRRGLSTVACVLLVIGGSRRGRRLQARPLVPYIRTRRPRSGRAGRPQLIRCSRCGSRRRQPPLPAVVDRRLPAHGQRPQQHHSGADDLAAGRHDRLPDAASVGALRRLGVGPWFCTPIGSRERRGPAGASASTASA